jgi:hypothetical protein
VWDYWPKYPLDNLYGKYPDVSSNTTSMLILNGDLDASTPFYWATWAAAHYTNGDLTFIKVPNAAHVTIHNSPVISGGDHCGLQMLASFARSSGKAVDRSCLDQLAPLDWRCETDEVKLASAQLLGTPDAWGNN